MKKHEIGFLGLPGCPVVKTSPSNAVGVGSIPGWGAKIPHASWPKEKKNRNRTKNMGFLSPVPSTTLGTVKQDPSGRGLAEGLARRRCTVMP